MDSIAVPKTFEDLVEEWRNHSDRKVLLVDETRDSLADEHREFIVFTAVLVDASALLELLDAVLKVRGALPEVSRDESFKGKNLLHIFSDSAFRPLVLLVGKALAPPARIFIAATTIKNVQESKAKVVIRSAKDNGRPLTVSGPELKVAVNFIRQLGDDVVGPTGRLDVVLDRSQALGLDAGTRHLESGQFEGFFGKLVDDGPDFAVVPDSDGGVLRDALLLPDFAGYLLVHKTPDQMKNERVTVTSGTPFFFREVLSSELASAVSSAMEP
jgi:hypothetical protein